MNTMKSRFVVILLGLFLLAVGVTSAQDEQVPRYEPAEGCFIEIETEIPYDCGYVIVPEFHDHDSGNSISLAVVRLRTSSEAPESPIVFGAGGPGGSMLDWAPSAAYDAEFNETGSYANWLETRDLIFFGQRGTMHSVPFLNCPEANEADVDSRADLTFDERLRLEVELVQVCYDRFVEEGVSFDAFDSVQNAADVNAIREVFGYDQIVYYGESYGTMLGQHIMRDFPEILESVILDGTTSLAFTSWAQDSIRNYQASLERLIAICDADPLCSETYPDFAENIDLVYQQAQTNPLSFTADDEEVAITPGILSTTLYTNLYMDLSLAQFPSVLEGFANGKTQGFELFYANANSAMDDIGFLMHYAVVCAEDPVLSEEDATPLDYEPFGIVLEHSREDADSYIPICQLLDVPPLPDSTDVNVSSDIPTLVLSGALDPATPNFRSEEVADGLSNSFYFLFPYGTHVQARPSTNCATQIMSQFVNDPMTEPDGSCIDALPAIEFLLPLPTIADVLGREFNALGIFVVERGEFVLIPEDNGYSITFLDDGLVTIVASCNTITANYTTGEDGALSIDLGASTLVECPDAPVLEDFMTVIENATQTSFVRTGDAISLSIVGQGGSYISFMSAE